MLSRFFLLLLLVFPACGKPFTVYVNISVDNGNRTSSYASEVIAAALGELRSRKEISFAGPRDRRADFEIDAPCLELGDGVLACSILITRWTVSEFGNAPQICGTRVALALFGSSFVLYQSVLVEGVLHADDVGKAIADDFIVKGLEPALQSRPETSKK